MRYAIGRCDVGGKKIISYDYPKGTSPKVIAKDVRRQVKDQYEYMTETHDTAERDQKLEKDQRDLTKKPSAYMGGDYYLNPEGEIEATPGMWIGKGVQALGLPQTINFEDYVAVAEGKDPKTGARLVELGGKTHVSFVEFTFSPDKTISLLYALCPSLREGILADHQAAVAYTLRRMEERSEPMRHDVETVDALGTKKRETVHGKTAGLVVGVFTHTTSRPSAKEVKAQEQDPHSADCAPACQLHTHCQVANLALRPKPGAKGNEFGGIDSRAFYSAQVEMGATYATDLAARVQKRFVPLVRNGDFLRVKGISERVRDNFSPRHNEIVEYRKQFEAANGRPPTAEEAYNFGLITRHEKAVADTMIFERWIEKAAELGLTEADILQVISEEQARQAAGIRNSRIVGHIEPEQVIEAALKALTEDRGQFSYQKLKDYVASEACGQLESAELAILLETIDRAKEQDKPELVHGSLHAGLNRKKQTMLTTIDSIDLEKRCFELMADIATRSPEPLTEEELAAGELASGYKLNEGRDQYLAVRQLNTAPLKIMEAPPGTGKGVVARVYAFSHKQKHPTARIIATSVAGKKSVELGEELGSDAKAMTIESFVGDKQRIDSNTLVFCDEANIMDSERWLQLLTKVSKAGAQLVVIGDRKQLGKVVGLGGLFAHFADAAAKTDTLATLTENRRIRLEGTARENEIIAWAALRRGLCVEKRSDLSPDQWDEAVARGTIVKSEKGKPTEVIVNYADDALTYWDRQGRVIVKQTKEQVVDEAIRLWLSDTLAEKESLIITDGGRYLTDELNQTAQGALRREGRLGEQITNTEFRDGEYLRNESIYKGDRIAFTRTSFMPVFEGHGKTQLVDVRTSNGTSWVATSGTTDGGVVLKSKSVTIVVPKHKLDRITLDYASSVHRAEGRTVDTTQALPAGWQTHNEGAGVFTTRSRDHCNLLGAIDMLVEEPKGLLFEEARRQVLDAMATRFGDHRPDETSHELLVRLKEARLEEELKAKAKARLRQAEAEQEIEAIRKRASFIKQPAAAISPVIKPELGMQL